MEIFMMEEGLSQLWSSKMELKNKLLTLPKKPGCYQMKNKEGRIIYVGKAINLFNRVNSYFRGAHDYKTTKLVSHIVDFDYLVTKNEKEALILEYNLIKEHNPEYNIMFRDDQSYPYILLNDCGAPFCRVVRLQKNKNFSGKLFGPYPNVGAARATVELINRLFPTRKCHPLKKELCLYYHIHQCLGYCVYHVPEQLLKNTRQKIISFLTGDIREMSLELEKNMNDAACNQQYEKAAEYRDLLESIRYVVKKQDVQTNNKEDFDVFNYALQDGYISINGFFIRQGKLLSSHKFIDYLVGDPENYVSSYLYHFYHVHKEAKCLYIEKEILRYIKDAFSFPVKTVSRGQKLALLKQARQNAKIHLEQHRDMIEKKERYLIDAQQELKRIFGHVIHRIELFDNSHTAGKDTVAAMVVFKDLKPFKKEYRLFKIKDSADDIQSMKEVIYRRYFRLLRERKNFPDLIIVDGGRLQIKAAKEVLDSLGVDIALAGLEKDKHHDTRYLLNQNGEKIKIQKSSNLFFALANMQDEVHRFAVTYHKKRRQKSIYHSLLDDIVGLGPKRKLRLLKEFKSIENIRLATLEELEKHVPHKIALSIKEILQEKR